MDKPIELQTLDDELHLRARTSVMGSKVASDFDRDRYDLARAGKQQVLKVRLVQRLSKRKETHSE